MLCPVVALARKIQYVDYPFVLHPDPLLLILSAYRMFGISRRYSQFEMWKMTDPARRADGILITTTELASLAFGNLANSGRYRSGRRDSPRRQIEKCCAQKPSTGTTLKVVPVEGFCAQHFSI